MSDRIVRLGSSWNGKPVVAIDPDLLASLEGGEQVIRPKETASVTGKQDVASEVSKPADEKPVKPKLTDDDAVPAKKGK